MQSGSKGFHDKLSQAVCPRLFLRQASGWLRIGWFYGELSYQTVCCSGHCVGRAAYRFFSATYFLQVIFESRYCILR